MSATFQVFVRTADQSGCICSIVALHTPPSRALLARASGALEGQVVFAGTRVPVQGLFGYLLLGGTVDLFVSDYPEVTKEHAEAVLELARDTWATDDALLDEAPPDPLCPRCRARAMKSTRGSRKRCPHRPLPAGPGLPGVRP